MVLYGALTKIGPFRNSEEQTCHKGSQSLLVRLLTLRWQGINGWLGFRITQPPKHSWRC